MVQVLSLTDHVTTGRSPLVYKQGRKYLPLRVGTVSMNYLLILFILKSVPPLSFLPQYQTFAFCFLPL